MSVFHGVMLLTLGGQEDYFVKGGCQKWIFHAKHGRIDLAGDNFVAWGRFILSRPKSKPTHIILFEFGFKALNPRILKPSASQLP